MKIFEVIRKFSRKLLRNQAPEVVSDEEVIATIQNVARHFSGNDVLFDLSTSAWWVKGDIPTGAMGPEQWGIHRIKIAASTAETSTLNDPLAPGLLLAF